MLKSDIKIETAEDAKSESECACGGSCACGGHDEATAEEV